VKPSRRAPVEREMSTPATHQPQTYREGREVAQDVDWANLTLPVTWPDQLNLRNPLSIVRVLSHLCRKRPKVVIPGDWPGMDWIPAYVLQEFHHLPNGNYSDVLTRGYITGFDRFMLGQMQRVREHIAGRLAACHSILDLGCGGGKTAAAIHAKGITDVWGLEPSPYLLRHAARNYPHIRFVQGVMEKLPFPNQRFDGISACFVFHEVPPLYIRQALEEISRVLKPGGLLVIAEPSPIQLRDSFFAMIRKFGWQGGYFQLLARLLHEPFVNAWHAFALADEAAKKALHVLEESEGMPVKSWVLQRCPRTIDHVASGQANP
jgi:ubiquinone/menaquinone biosynthesis C-methylase UbiE